MSDLIEHDIFGMVPRAKGINSKKKGDKNESNLTKWLTKWVGSKFYRVPRSGGLDWGFDVRGITGDVTTGDDSFILSVETKHYKNVSFGKGGKLRKNSIILNFWEQAVEDAERAARVPILFVRKNGMAKNTWVVYIADKNLKDIFEGVGCTPLSVGHGLYGYSSDDIINLCAYKILSNFVPYGNQD